MCAAADVKASMSRDLYPNPAATPEGGMDVTQHGCSVGMCGYMQNPSCCALPPRWNWVIATCDPNKTSADQDGGQFCRNPSQCPKGNPPTIPDDAQSCSADIDYIASYQWDSSRSEWRKVTDSSVDDWDSGKDNFKWVGGDWPLKWAPTFQNRNQSGIKAPQGLGPPGMLFVMSARDFYYGSFFLLTQLGLNNQQAQRDGDPRVTSNCWANEFDFLEGTGGWCAYGLKRNINDLFMTDSAQYLATACMAILGPRQSAVSRVFGAHCTTWSCCEGVNYCPADAPYAAFVGDNATVAKSFASFVGNDGSGGDWTIQPDCYNRSTIEAALAAAARNSSLGAQLIGPANLDLGGCGSYIVNGGAETNSYWTAGKGVRYMYAFVVDKLGVWGYRWRPEQFSPSPWPGLTPKEAATTLSDSRPTYRPPDGSLELVTPCTSDEKFCVRFQPGTPGDLACMRSVREDINGRPFHDIVYAAKEGKGLNWWDLFDDTKQYNGFPPTIMSGLGQPLDKPCTSSNCK